MKWLVTTFKLKLTKLHSTTSALTLKTSMFIVMDSYKQEGRWDGLILLPPPVFIYFHMEENLSNGRESCGSFGIIRMTQLYLVFLTQILSLGALS